MRRPKFNTTVLLAKVVNERHVVFDHQHGQPFPRDRLEKGRELGGLAGIEAGSRLIQHQEARPAHKRAYHFDLFAHAVGEAVHIRVGIDVDTGTAHALFGALPPLALALPGQRAEQGSHVSRQHMLPEHDIFNDGEVRHQTDVLERARQSRAHTGARRQILNRPPVENNGA